MIKKAYDIIILAIIWIVSIFSIAISLLKHYELGFQNYIGYGLLIFITFLKINKVKRIKTILGLFLILGSFNLFQFTFFTNTMFFTWSPLGRDYSIIGLQPLSMLLLIFFIITNFSNLVKIIVLFFSEDSKYAVEKQKQIELKYYEELKNKPLWIQIHSFNNKEKNEILYNCFIIYLSFA